MAVAFQLYVADPDEVAKGAEPFKAGFDFTGMTPEQAQIALKAFRTTIDKIEAHMKKYGTGEVLPEPPSTGGEAPEENETDRILRARAVRRESEEVDGEG